MCDRRRMLAGLHMRGAHCGLVDQVLRDPLRESRATGKCVCVLNSVVLRVRRQTIEGIQLQRPKNAIESVSLKIVWDMHVGICTCQDARCRCQSVGLVGLFLVRALSQQRGRFLRPGATSAPAGCALTPKVRSLGRYGIARLFVLLVIIIHCCFVNNIGACCSMNSIGTCCSVNNVSTCYSRDSANVGSIAKTT